MEIKENLYAEIDKLGKNYIRTQLSNDISNSKTIINLIFNNCLNLLNKNNPVEDEYVLFSEALLHFVLTVSMIPSERKISLNNIDIDVVVPNSKNLKADNEGAIIIHFVKGKNKNVDDSLKKLSKIQTNRDNIWIVSSKDIDVRIKTFIVSSFSFKPNAYRYHFSEIIIKMNEFLQNINYSGLKII